MRDEYRTGAVSGAAAMILMLVLGCSPALPPSKPLAELTTQEAAGYAVFASRCSGCHDANSQKAVHGPGLQGLFRKHYLPSGAPANDERVSSAILEGRGMMPAFGDNLNERQLEELLAYLHTL